MPNGSLPCCANLSLEGASGSLLPAAHAHNRPMMPRPSCPARPRTGPSIWRPPWPLSLRWWPVFLRNLLVWRKLAIPSLVGNIAEPLMWLVAFGYGMGALVGTWWRGPGCQGALHPVLASGSICMSAMNAASFEALYSASRMHVQKTWEGIMNAPVGSDDVVLAEMLWAAFKALFTVTAILLVMLALGISHSPKLLVAWPVLLFVHHVFEHCADLQRAWPRVRLLPTTSRWCSRP